MTRAVLVLGFAVVLSLTGCSSYYDSDDLDAQYYEDEYDTSEFDAARDGARAEQYYRDSFAERHASSRAAGVWTCTYAPTMNEDWHDDAVCSNGSERHRPYLREWDNFVTQTELMESAREYAAELNAR